MTQHLREPYIEIEDQIVYRRDIKKMTFAEFKQIACFLDEPTLEKVANWHGDQAIDYVQELQRTLNKRTF